MAALRELVITLTLKGLPGLLIPCSRAAASHKKRLTERISCYSIASNPACTHTDEFAQAAKQAPNSVAFSSLAAEPQRNYAEHKPRLRRCAWHQTTL